MAEEGSESVEGRVDMTTGEILDDDAFNEEPEDFPPADPAPEERGDAAPSTEESGTVEESAETPSADEGEEEFEPFYQSLDEWVSDWLLPNYSRPLEDPAKLRWDPQWWRYAEVQARLEALWGSWEKFRLEGGPGMVVFYRDYLDPMMRVIMDPDGPFHTYNPHMTTPDGPRDKLPDPLPEVSPPDGMFTLD